MNPNVELRQRVSKIIRPNLQTLLVIALIAALPGLISNLIVTLSGSDLAMWLPQKLFTIMTVEELDETAEVLEEITSSFESWILTKGWILPVLSLMEALVTPMLILGFYHAVLSLLRGGTATVGTVFSRRKSWFRAALLNLWVAIKIFLWMLPGVAVMLLSVFAGLRGFDLFVMVGSTLMLILSVMAAYRYAMATLVLADEPETGIRSCVRRSMRLMERRKTQLFMLECPYLFGSWLAATLLTQLLGTVIGGTLSMFVQLILTVYLYGVRCAFYDVGRENRGQKEPVVVELPDHEGEDADHGRVNG